MSSNYSQAQSAYQKAINPDEYVDIALKNILTYNARVAEQDSVDLNKVRDMLVYLVNNAENVCLGTGYIIRKKKKFDMEELSESEQALYSAAIAFFKTKENIFGANIERFAARLLEEAVDGEYDSKVKSMKTKLDLRVEEKELDSKAADLQLANYKFQLMLDAVQSTKARKADFHV